MHRFLAALLSTLLVLVGLMAGSATLLSTDAHAAMPNPFRVEGVGVKLAPKGVGVVQVRIIVPPGHHIYRDQIRVRPLDAGAVALGVPSLPPGIPSPDPANPANSREMYDLDVIIEVPVEAPDEAGLHPVRLEVGYQGCRSGLCYMPVLEEVMADVRVEAKPSATDGATYGPFGGDAAWVSAGGAPSAAVQPRSDAPIVDLSALPATADVRPAGMEDRPHPVRARLLVDRDGVRPGDTLRLGVHLTQDPGWHTYWKSPGDIGLPTDITWGLPAGTTAAPYQYPVPHRYDVQGIISYGYDEQVLLFTELRLPADLPAGDHTLSASVAWLVCEVMCIPGSAELALPITVSAATGPAPTPATAAPLFDFFAAQHPVSPVQIDGAAIEAALSTTAVRGEDTFEVAFLVTPTGDEPVRFSTGEGAGSWPAFTPIAPNPTWMVTGVAVSPAARGAMLVVMKGEAFDNEPLPTADQVGGLLQFDVGGRRVATEVLLDLPWAAAGATVQASTSPLFALGAPDGPAASTPDPTPPAPPAEERSFVLMLALAFVGGAILNIMPCVLPVLTLKLYSLVAQQDAGDAHRRKAGVAYSAGIVASFLGLASLIVGLKASFGTSVGWGFQFQYPGYVAALATIVFAFGLSLFGVFELPALGANKAAQASSKEGMAGYFLTGVFTTLLATPCSAPFLGTGMGFAFSLPAWGILLFFAVAGLGLASPFLAIAFVPAMMRFLPRPGAWMETFKQLMGFTLVATTVWLVDVLGAQIGMNGVTGFLVFLTAVGLGGWVFGRFGGPTQPVSRQVFVFAAAVAISAAAFIQFVDLSFAEPDTAAAGAPVSADALAFDEEIPWQAFSDERLAELNGHPVFIDFTAEWCLTCKVNEKTVLETAKVRDGMERLGVVPLKADWTRKDEEITRWLERYGRAGVPFYLMVPGDRTRDPIPLGEVITPQSVLDAMELGAS